jgi:hypothetical protein
MTKVYNPDEGFSLELFGIDAAPLYNDDNSPMTVTVLGADSDTAVTARNRTTNLRLQQGGRGVKLTAEGLESEGAAYLAKLTVGWNITPSKLVPGVDAGLGEGAVAFSAAAATAIYRNAKLAVIKKQIDDAIEERANFLRPSPTT